MRRPSYREALRWIVDNDDTEWLEDDGGHTSVTAAFLADMFGVTDERVRADLIKAKKQSA